jgi:hypothetical protein
LQQNDNNENFNSRNGLMNLENPHVIRRTNFQQKFSINIWAGIVNGMLIGPCVLPNRVNGFGLPQLFAKLFAWIVGGCTVAAVENSDTLTTPNF